MWYFRFTPSPKIDSKMFQYLFLSERIAGQEFSLNQLATKVALQLIQRVLKKNIFSEQAWSTLY